MRAIWAPWRLRYVKNAGKETGCFICDATKKKGDWQKQGIIWRGAHTIGLLNKFPYINGHIMVAPIRHLNSLNRLSDMEKTETMQVLARYEVILKQSTKCQGINIGINIGKAAGAGIPGHLHIHMVPRWNGDTNFMTTIVDTRIIPQSLPSVWKSIRDAEKHLLKGLKIQGTNLIDRKD